MASAEPLQSESVIKAIFHPDVTEADAAELTRRFTTNNSVSLLPMLEYAERGGDEDILRLLNCLDKLSPSAEMQHVLRHLLFQTTGRLQSKAALIYGHKFPDSTWFLQWACNVLEERDPRVRANAIESLWGLKHDASTGILHKGLEDENHRVVGNAVLGLYLLGDAQAVELLRDMAKSESPDFRGTAAFVMGETGNAEFLSDLKTLVSDEKPTVRFGAVRAVLKIQRAKSKA